MGLSYFYKTSEGIGTFDGIATGRDAWIASK
jgi:hypothetical protein